MRNIRVVKLKLTQSITQFIFHPHYTTPHHTTPQALEAAAGANSNAAKTIAGSVSLQKFSYKNIKLAIEFFQMGGSCPALPETGGANGGCKTINPNPSVAACVPYNAGKHYATIKAAKEANVAKEEVAKNKLNFVPWNKVIGAYDSIV